MERPLARSAAQLHATNNFPEFTGRICPAPCEAACVLGINEPPVTIKVVEQIIIDRGFAGRLGSARTASPPDRKTCRDRRIRSGRARRCSATESRRPSVTVLEKHDRIGGLLRYGIPDFKLEKWVVDRRLEQLYEEGIEFRLT